MECCLCHVDHFQFIIADPNAFGVDIGVQFGADDQIGGLLFTQINRLSSRGHSRSQVPVLAKALGQHGAQGGVGLNHKHPLQGPFSENGNSCRRWGGGGRGSDLVRGALQPYFDVST